MSRRPEWHSTTILCVRHNGQCAMGGDGQVTHGTTILKADTKKIRWLLEKKVLARPNFYISGFLEQNRAEYYQRLLDVSGNGDWTGWCVFFLTAVRRQAEINEAKVRALLELYRSDKSWIVDATHSPYAMRALDWIFARPIFKTSDFIAGSGMPSTPAKRIVRILKEQGRLVDLRAASGNRSAIVAYPALLNIAEGADVF